MKIRWQSGQFTFWPENDQETAILSHTWRELRASFAAQQDEILPGKIPVRSNS